MRIITIDQNAPKEIQKILKDLEKEASDYLENKENKKTSLTETLINLKDIFGLKKIPKTINSFDNTNFSGHFSTGVCVFWQDGEFIKNQYRRYNFKELEKGSDDFGMMKEMLTRRIKEIISKNIEVDLFLIDGGKMQKTALMQALTEINFFYQEFDIDFICIAKGENRNARNETFFTKDLNDLKLNIYSKEIKLIQSLRDEAHRFASVNLKFKTDKSLFKEKK